MSKIHETIGRHVLIDDNALVVDLKNSHGSWFVDAVTGRKYLDCFSQYASMPLGWNHPDVLKQIDKFEPSALIHKVANSDILSTPYADFVETFERFAQDFQYFYFVDGGTLGCENALKAAFDYRSQKYNLKDNEMDVIHLQHAFHGRSGYMLSSTNTTPDKTDRYPKFTWTRITCPDASLDQNLESESLEQAEKALQKGNVACIILEPILSEGGDIHLRPSFLGNIRRLADQYDALLIFDEVQTAMMTGKFWAYQHFGICPDMVCFGKKLQVCGFCCTKKIDEVKNNVFKVHSRINSTWGGNLVDMIRSTIFMKVIHENNLIDSANAVGEYFLNKLQCELSEPITNIRGRGLMIAFDLPSTEIRNTFLGNVSKEVLVLKCGDKSIRLRPALTFSKEDADIATSVFKKVLGSKK